jgi:tRNA (guanine37-N1)-methyltransferase
MKKGMPLLRVERTAGERVRQLLKQLSLMDREQKITSNVRFVEFPLVREPSPRESSLIRDLAPDATFETVERRRLKGRKRPHSVIEILRDNIAPSLLKRVKHSFDIIGDIAVIEAPEELSLLKESIAKAIIEVHKDVKTVLCKSGAIDGKFRVRGYELVLGDEKTETMHVEHGCRFMLDIAKVYFSPRLATEHLRVASQIKNSEVVVDMFAGIGPFSILIAKKRGALVHSMDANPDAIKYLKMNCVLNKVDHLVHPMLGDARELTMKNLKGVADRIIMNLPSESLEFVDAACLTLKPEGGVIHSYQFQHAPAPLEKAVEALRTKVESANRELYRISEARFVKSVAPHEWHVVVDAAVR